MGMMTDRQISAWQQEHGIEPATGEYLKNLEALSQFAYDLIRTIEIEKSGIRDGDGAWHGSDVIGALCRDGRNLLATVRERPEGYYDTAECGICHEEIHGGGCSMPWPQPDGPEGHFCWACTGMALSGALSAPHQDEVCSPPSDVPF